MRLTLSESGAMALERYSLADARRLNRYEGSYQYDARRGLTLTIGGRAMPARYLPDEDRIELESGGIGATFSRSRPEQGSPLAGRWSAALPSGGAQGSGETLLELTLSGDGAMRVILTRGGEALISQSGEWSQSYGLVAFAGSPFEDARYDAEADALSVMRNGTWIALTREASEAGAQAAASHAYLGAWEARLGGKAIGISLSEGGSLGITTAGDIRAGAFEAEGDLLTLILDSSRIEARYLPEGDALEVRYGDRWVRFGRAKAG